MPDPRDERDASAAVTGPDFSGPEERAAPAPAAPAMPQYADAAPAAPPQFADPEPPAPPPAATPAPVPAPVAAPPRHSPWPARIIAALVVLSMVAIALAVVLPRQRTQMQPSGGGPTTEAQVPSQPGGEAPGATTGEQGARAEAAQTASAAGWGQATEGAAGPGQNPAAPSPSGPGGAEGVGAGDGQSAATGGQTTATGPGAQEGQGGAGAGTETCGNCGGTGRVTCPMKHLPNGHLLNPWFWNEPRYYSGNDPLLPDEADLGVCPLCQGTYQARCPRCEGRGEVDPAAALPKDFDPSGVGGFDLSALQGMATGMMGGQ